MKLIFLCIHMQWFYNQYNIGASGKDKHYRPMKTALARATDSVANEPAQQSIPLQKGQDGLRMQALTEGS